MAITDDFSAIVKRLRGWGFDVVEWSGCYGRSNGLGWSSGKPVGHINHHYVCSMNPDQGYINGLVGNLASGTVVNWFADVNGKGYLIGTGPMNHAGTGNSSVLNKTKNDQPPSGPSGSAGDMTGNTYYSGTECQHPGDFTTPWPEPMVKIMIAINAAEFLQWGYSCNRAIDHYEWTNRKIDMSWLGGANSGTKAGNELRKRVDEQMQGTKPPIPPGVKLPLLQYRTPDGVDWAYADDMSFIMRIPNSAFYNNLQFMGFIAVDHGKAKPCEQNIIDWTKGVVNDRGGKVYEPAQ